MGRELPQTEFEDPSPSIKMVLGASPINEEENHPMTIIYEPRA